MMLDEIRKFLGLIFYELARQKERHIIEACIVSDRVHVGTGFLRQNPSFSLPVNPLRQAFQKSSKIYSSMQNAKCEIQNQNTADRKE